MYRMIVCMYGDHAGMEDAGRVLASNECGYIINNNHEFGNTNTDTVKMHI